MLFDAQNYSLIISKLPSKLSNLCHNAYQGFNITEVQPLLILYLPSHHFHLSTH